MSEPKKSKKPSRQQVYTLLVEIGRKEGDGLPDKATGAALMCFASGIDEAEAVRETVAILKQADTANVAGEAVKATAGLSCRNFGYFFLVVRKGCLQCFHEVRPTEFP